MATYGDCTFDELGDGNGSGTSFVSAIAGRRLTIPGAAGTLFQRNNAATHTLDTQALCSYAEIEALRGRVGDSDMLTLQNTAGSAMLLSVRPQRVFDSSCYVAALTFRFAGSFNVPGTCGYGNCFGESFGN